MKMWRRITNQFKEIGRTAIINQTLDVEDFPSKEKAIPKGSVLSPTFGGNIYEKGTFYYQIYEVSK